MTRSIHQYRPKGDPTAAPYAPQRDLANIYTPFLREVFQGLDEKNWSEFLREWFDRDGVTEEDLGAGVTVFVEAHLLFTRDRTVDSPWTAFDRAGVNDLKPSVRAAIFERIGECIMGGWFIAVRDVTMQAHESPGHTDFVQMMAAGRELAHRLSGHTYVDHDTELEEARADAEETKRVLGQAHTAVEEANRERFQAESVRDAEIKRNVETVADIAPITAVLGRNWFVRFFSVAKIAWKLYWRMKL